jgi:hypothetical protein
MKHDNVKRLIVLMIISISLSNYSFSQYILDSDFKSMFPKVEDKIAYEKIYSFDSLPKSEIIFRIKQWGSKAFSSQKESLQSEDLETGYIIYQGLTERQLSIPKGWGFSFGEPRIYSVDYAIKFNVNFYVKNNKFKVSINNITNDAVSALANWDVTSPKIYTKLLLSEPIFIENAGDAILREYNENPSKKNGIRLNYTAEMWRKIHVDMITILSSIRDEVVNKSKSEFNF